MTTDHDHVVLFVDDCASLRDAFTRLLAARGYQTRAAGSGAEALAILADGFRPCVVLLDQNMPGMRGVGVAARMRGRRELRAVPIVFMSGAAPSGELAARPALVKPFDAADLFAAVEAHARCPAATPEIPTAPPAARGDASALQRHIDATLGELRAQLATARDLRGRQAQLAERLRPALQAHKRSA